MTTLKLEATDEKGLYRVCGHPLYVRRIARDMWRLHLHAAELPREQVHASCDWFSRGGFSRIFPRRRDLLETLEQRLQSRPPAWANRGE